jgi:hypothetical protein
MAEAWYGHGHAQLSLQDREAAAASLCQANELADPLLSGEIHGLLAREDIVCRGEGLVPR